jgi:GT2 family glycosyltransferase
MDIDRRTGMISVVVVTRNSAGCIAACLGSLFPQMVSGDEVIVVDNASGDGTVELVRGWATTLIANACNRGACSARNQGIDIARGDWVLTLDSDVILADGFLAHFREFQASLPDKVGMVQTQILDAQGVRVYSQGIALSAGRRFVDVNRGRRVEAVPGTRPILGPCSAAAFYRRNMLLRLKEPTGYFDARFFFLVEDVDLAWRARRAGWAAARCLLCVCYHAGNGSATGRALRQYLSWRNRYLMIVKNEHPLGRVGVLAMMFPYECARLIWLLGTNHYMWKKIAACMTAFHCRGGLRLFPQGHVRPAMERYGIYFFFLSFLALRLYNLGGHDFWYDEMFSIDYAAHPWGNWNAPLYWIVLHFWTMLAGVSEFSLRLPSAVFSFLTVVLTYRLGLRLFGRRTAWLAASLAGLSSFHLWYAQEARDYALVVLLGTLSSYLLLKALRQDGLEKWLGFAVAALAAVYTNYFALFLVAAQLLYAGFVLRRRAWKAGLVAGVIALGFCSYLPLFLSKFGAIARGFWVPKPDGAALLITLQNYMLGYSGTAGSYALSLGLTVVLSGVAIVRLFRHRTQASGAWFCAACLGIPLTGIFAFSIFFFSVYLNRALLVFSPYFYLLMAAAVWQLPRRWAIGAAGMLLGIAAYGAVLYFADHLDAPLAYHQGAYIKAPIRMVARFIDALAVPDDIVAFTNEAVLPGAAYYARRKRPLYFIFAPEVQDSTWHTPRWEGPLSVPAAKAAALPFRRLWVIESNWARDGGLDENAAPVRAVLDRRLSLVSRWQIDGVWLSCYKKPEAL